MGGEEVLVLWPHSDHPLCGGITYRSLRAPPSLACAGGWEAAGPPRLTPTLHILITANQGVGPKLWSSWKLSHYVALNQGHFLFVCLSPWVCTWKRFEDWFWGLHENVLGPSHPPPATTQLTLMSVGSGCSGEGWLLIPLSAFLPVSANQGRVHRECLQSRIVLVLDPFCIPEKFGVTSSLFCGSYMKG